jgi:hypothetical protein
MAVITPAMQTAFRDQGYVVVPAALDTGQVAAGRRLAEGMLAARPLLAHYLLGHNSGPHDGGAGAGLRHAVYYRLLARGHRDRWREAVTDPLLEFA